MSDPVKPTTETDRPNLSTEYQHEGGARRPAEHLDKDQPAEIETTRKTSLT